MTQSLDIAAYRRSRASVDLGDGAREVAVECVSTGYFGVLGVQPSRGTAVGVLGETGSVPDVVLAEAVWRRRLGADAGVVGREVRLNGRTATIVGIAPAGFQGVQPDAPEAWVLLSSAPDACTPHGVLADSTNVTVLGRPRPGVTPQAAAGELQDLLPSLSPSDGRWFESIADAERPFVRSDFRAAAWAAGGAAVLLLMAGANVGGLLLLQADRRRSEFAIRRQLGAGTGRIVGMLLREHAAIGLAAIVAGAVLAQSLRFLLREFVPAAIDRPLLDGRALAVMLACGAVTAGISIVVPVVRSARERATGFRTTGTTSTARSGTADAILTLQAALAFLLIAAAGLMVRSVANLTRTAGYDVDRLIVLTLDLRSSGYVSDDDLREVFQRLQTRLGQVGTVEQIAMSSTDLLPLTSDAMVVFIQRQPGEFAPAVTRLPGAIVQGVAPGYFEATGTAIVRGREFSATDTGAAPAVTIVDRSLAEANWPDADPIGRCAFIKGSPECLRVVGVAESRRRRLLERRTPEVFLPMTQAGRVQAAWAVPRALLMRVKGNVRKAQSSVASAAREVAADYPVRVESVADRASQMSRSRQLAMRMFTWCGATAALMAIVGLYAAFAFRIQTRKREIGLRLALGAAASRAILPVFRNAAVVMAVGAVAGAALIAATDRFGRAMLFEVAPLDPANLAIAAGLLCLAGGLGLGLPALRAARTDPATVLREM